MPFWVPVAARKQLRLLAAEMDTTQQELLTIALNDFFIKHGKPPIA
jgi:antitoxin-like ribbon-helix-helix protein